MELKKALARLFPPQHYAARERYRPPAAWYRRLNRLVGVPLTSWGLAPRDAVTLEVRGRRSGRPRRTPVLLTEHRDATYLVSLAGESHWVRNVRAASGEVVLRRRWARHDRLQEVPAPGRAAVLAAYLTAARQRSGPEVAEQPTRDDFGLDHPTLGQLGAVAERYPVFLITDHHEIAPGVFHLGPWGRTRTNAYAVRTETGWALIDTGWSADAPGSAPPPVGCSVAPGPTSSCSRTPIPTILERPRNSPARGVVRCTCIPRSCRSPPATSRPCGAWPPRWIGGSSCRAVACHGSTTPQ